MDRLTARSPKNNKAYLAGVNKDEQELTGSYNTLMCVRDAFERLAQYEETGLTPQEVKKLRGELERYKQWVNDLQSGMYVNCVYCGHRYGPADKVPVSMADALKQHIEQCSHHPLTQYKRALNKVCTDLACDDQCPHGEPDFTPWPECENCPGHEGEIHQDTERDIKCWERYYLQQEEVYK